MDVKKALKAIDAIYSRENKGTYNALEHEMSVNLSDLRVVIEALGKPEVKECEHQWIFYSDANIPIVLRTWFVCNKCGIDTRNYPHGIDKPKKDPVREVYSKWKRCIESQGLTDSTSIERDMWAAIKQHSEQC